MAGKHGIVLATETCFFQWFFNPRTGMIDDDWLGWLETTNKLIMIIIDIDSQICSIMFPQTYRHSDIQSISEQHLGLQAFC
jgi:hypothetical protein